MKKIQEINRLVEEALKELQSADVKIEVRKILTTLARKCAEINEEDFDYYSRKILYYNSRLRDGQVETPEQKQEEKPALQPLPEALPDFMLHYNRSELSSLQLWEKIRQHFGTQPREWWMDLKKGDKFVFNNGAIREVKTFNGIIDKSSIKVYLGNEESEVRFVIDYCSPYTDPAQSFRSKLTPEMQVEFDKVVSSLTTNTPQP